jgi:hypothetical protein
MRTAAGGNSTFANDWQWVFGNPAVSAFGTAVIAALGAFAPSLAARFGASEMTTEMPALDAFIGAFAAFIVTWLVAFSVRLAAAPVNLFYGEKKRADESDAKFVTISSGGLPTRNVSVSDAIAYVAFREWGHRFLNAIAAASAPMVKANAAYDAFLQGIADSAIPVWGKRQEGGVHEPVPNVYWFDNRLDFKDLMLDNPSSEPNGASFKGDCYHSLMTSREAVETYWPRVGEAGPRAVSALQIAFGTDHAYKSAKTRNLHQYERILSFKLTNRGPKTLSECRVIAESVDVNTGIIFPQVLANGIKLAPGDHVFVPFVSYGEPMNTAIGDAGDSFTCLATPEPKPFFDVGENVSIKLRATGIDTLPHEAQCRMWVDENGRLQIQGE